MWDASGADLNRALLSVGKAQRSQNLEDIGTALGELQAVWIGLPAGSPMRAEVLVPMARMQGMLAMQTGQKMSAAEAAETAIEALRASTGPGEVHAAAHLLIALFSMMISRGQRRGRSRRQRRRCARLWQATAPTTGH